MLHHRTTSRALLLGLLLSLPTLFLGFTADDWFHLALVERQLGVSVVEGPMLDHGQDALGLFSLFQFAPPDPEHVALEVHQGHLPWWTPPGFQLAFWRPLSSGLALLDYRLFGRTALGWHLHSLLWHLGLIGCVGLLYRRVLPAVGGLALLLYLVDDARLLPVSWVANRHALVEAVPALLGLLAHLRWRLEGWGPGRLLMPLGLAIGLSAGEGALGVCAYLFAWELVSGQGWPDRLRGLLPSMVVGLVWAIFYHLGGYGAYGTGYYDDPLSDPTGWARAALLRGPAMLASLLGGLPADLAVLWPDMVPVLALVGSLLAGGVVVLLRRAWKELPDPDRGALRWLVPGALLSLLPVLSAEPADRLLLWPGIGGMAVVAMLLRWAWGSGRRLLAAGLGGMHIAVSGLFALATLATFFSMQARIPTWRDDLSTLLAEQPEADALLVQGSDPFAAWYLTDALRLEGIPSRGRWWIASMGAGDKWLSRPQPDMLILEATTGELFSGHGARIYRDAERLPLQPGEEIELDGIKVRVEATDGIWPTRLGLVLDSPDRTRLIAWGADGFEEVAMPVVGGSVELPWLPGPMEMPE